MNDRFSGIRSPGILELILAVHVTSGSVLILIMAQTFNYGSVECLIHIFPHAAGQQPLREVPTQAVPFWIASSRMLMYYQHFRP